MRLTSMSREHLRHVAHDRRSDVIVEITRIGAPMQHAQVLTQRLLEERQHGGLARARSAGEDDPSCFVALSASAVDHRHSSTIWLSRSGVVASQPNVSPSRLRNASEAPGSPWVTNTRRGAIAAGRSHSISSA